MPLFRILRTHCIYSNNLGATKSFRFMQSVPVTYEIRDLGFRKNICHIARYGNTHKKVLLIEFLDIMKIKFAMETLDLLFLYRILNKEYKQFVINKSHFNFLNILDF